MWPGLAPFVRLAVVLLAFALSTSVSAQTKRVALVIGNGSYVDRPLRSPSNDAALMQRVLEQIGFKVQVVRDGDRRAMLVALRDFEARAANAEVAMFFYAGHGAQAGGINYLVPVGATIRSDADLPDEAIAADTVTARIESARARVGLVVLDACRDNPFTGSSRSSARGLARMSAPTGTIVAFSTAPGSTADDGGGSNGIYTNALARFIVQPGLDVKEVFEKTAIEVESLTSGKQKPREDIGLRGRFELIPGTTVASSEPRPPTARAAPTAPVAPTAGQIVKDCDVCPELVVVGAGSFEMGSNENPSEQPVHRVNVSSFLLGKTEVTQGQWKALMGSNPSKFSQCGDDCPVEQVSWEDAQAYAKKLSERTGKRYRLPSEAEWEYAARAGTKTKYWWGDTASHEYANYGKDECCEGLALGRDRWVNTAPVGQFLANAFGLDDMHGNVWEWVQDVWHESYSGAPADGTAWLAEGDQARRVLRGGSWYGYPWFLRSANRIRFAPVIRDFSAGLRIARTF